MTLKELHDRANQRMDSGRWIEYHEFLDIARLIIARQDSFK